MVIAAKIALITGAGSGIGQALALKLEKEGCTLVLSDISTEALNFTKSLLTKADAHHFAELDVTDYEAWRQYVDELIQKFNHLDIVINNAGVALGSYSVESVSIRDFEWLMKINFWGMVYGTKVCLPHLKKQKEACIANVSSILGMIGILNQAPYCASKFAIRGFTESLRMEAMLEFPHVNVLSIHPGGIKTNIAKNARWEEGDFTQEQVDFAINDFEKAFINTPAFAACEIVYAIKNDKQQLIIGKDARLINRIAWLFPVKYTKILYNRMIKQYDSLRLKVAQH